MKEVAKIYNNFLPLLKGGEQKAFWCILIKTVANGKANTVITNPEFMKYGSHLTKSRDIIKATNDMRERGLIFKVKDVETEGNQFRYGINLNKAQFG